MRFLAAPLRPRPPAAWTHEIGWLTVLFGIGQCIGPVLAGAPPALAPDDQIFARPRGRVSLGSN
jgi:hypothetical protein